MKTTRKSDSQIMQILSQATSGITVSGLCREHGMSSATFYKWRANMVVWIPQWLPDLKSSKQRILALKRSVLANTLKKYTRHLNACK